MSIFGDILGAGASLIPGAGFLQGLASDTSSYLGHKIGDQLFTGKAGGESTGAMMDYWKQMGVTSAEDLAKLQTKDWSPRGRVGAEAIKAGYGRALDQYAGTQSGRGVMAGARAAGDASALRGQASEGFARAAQQSGQNVGNISRQLQGAGPMPVAARSAVMEAAGRTASQGLAGAFGGASQQAAGNIGAAANIGRGAEQSAQSDIGQRYGMYVEPERMNVTQTNVAQALAPGATEAGRWAGAERTMVGERDVLAQTAGRFGSLAGSTDARAELMKLLEILRNEEAVT